MSLKKFFMSFIMLLALIGLSNAAMAAEVKKKATDVLPIVTAKIQAAIDAVPAGNKDEVVKLIKEASEEASELSANYKFEFERDKAMGKLKNARVKAKTNLQEALDELNAAKKAFDELPKFL